MSKASSNKAWAGLITSANQRIRLNAYLGERSLPAILFVMETNVFTASRAVLYFFYGMNPIIALFAKFGNGR